MKLVKVESSNIGQVGFEENYKLTINSSPINRMRVIFTNGGIYDY